MKKLISLIVTVFCVGMFALSAFADAFGIQPCAAECPNDKCNRFGWNVKKIARTEDGSEEVKCTHFQYGTDVINYYVVTYEGKCMFCGTSKTMQSRESDPPVCNGRSHI